MQHKKQALKHHLNTPAAHKHFLPLYGMHAFTITGVLALACFMFIMWQNNQANALQPLIGQIISGVDSTYLPTVVAPLEKKQYVYSASVRFAADNPYDNLRYAYDPGPTATKTSSIITLTTASALQKLETALKNNPRQAPELGMNLQQCSRLYVVRFEPGLTPYGGFTPLKDIKLKDGRTAYIHKNSTCIDNGGNNSLAAANLENVIASIESY